MSDKFYTPVEVAQKVLDKTKELIKAQKEELEKAEKKESCVEEMQEKSVKKCGQMSKSDKLKAFIEKRKAKKASKMEKMLGMNSGAPAPQMPQANESQPKPSIASQIGWPNTKK